jgi:hypothetical protein
MLLWSLECENGVGIGVCFNELFPEDRTRTLVYHPKSIENSIQCNFQAGVPVLKAQAAFKLRFECLDPDISMLRVIKDD